MSVERLTQCPHAPRPNTHTQSTGFYVTERALSNGRASASASDGGGAAFGTPAPVQLPTAAEVEADQAGFVSTIRRLCSPVYYSTLADGTIVRGFGGLPSRPPGGGGRPVLFVGNHQLFASDMYTVRARGWWGWVGLRCVWRRAPRVSPCHRARAPNPSHARPRPPLQLPTLRPLPAPR